MTLDAVLSWNDESGTEKQFRIYRSQASNPRWITDFNQLDTVSADTESYTDSDIPKVESLTYAVVAVNLAGESDPSISDTLNTTNQTLSVTAEDGENIAVLVTHTRSLTVSMADSDAMSASVSVFPLISDFVQAPDDSVEVGYGSAGEISYPDVNNQIEYNNGR